MVPGEFVEPSVCIFYGFSDRTVFHYFGIFIDQPFLEAHKYGICKTCPKFSPLFVSQAFIVSLTLHVIKQLYLCERIVGTLHVILSCLPKMSACMGPTAKKDNTFLGVQHLVPFVSVRLYGSPELAEEFQHHLSTSGTLVIVKELTSGHDTAHKPDITFDRLVSLVIHHGDCRFIRLYVVSLHHQLP